MVKNCQFGVSPVNDSDSEGQDLSAPDGEMLTQSNFDIVTRSNKEQFLVLISHHF